MVAAQVDQVTNSPLALSRESRRWHRSRVARLPLPWAAASLTRGFGALVEVPGIAPTPTRLDTTSTRRSALLATPAGSASAWLLSRNAQSSQSNAEGASERHSMACRVRRLMGWPHLLGRRPPCPITDTAVWELFEHTGDVESRQGQHDAPPVNVIVDDAAAHMLIQQILDAPALTLSEQGRDRDRQYDPHFGLLSCCAMPRLHTPEGDKWRVAPGRVRAAAAAAAGRTGCLPPLPYRPLSLSIAGQVGKGSDG